MTKFTQMAANEDEGGASRRRIHLREISGDGDVPLETVGQDLRAARIRRGDDLAAVSRSLKIRKDHLDALESDRLDDLPGKTYAIGFVRSYARYLGLDVAMVLDRFKAEISGRSDEVPLAIASIHQDESRRLPQGWRIVAAVVIIALLWGGWHIFFAVRDPGQAVPPPPKLTQAEPPKPSATVPMPAPSPSAVPAPENATAQPSATPATNVTPAQQQASATPVPQNDAVPAVPGKAYGQQNANGARVVIRAQDAVRVTVYGPDGKIYFNRDLKAGDSYPVPNLPGLTFATNNAGGVAVDLDGVALGRIGQPQQILGRVSLDPQSLADRFGTH